MESGSVRRPSRTTAAEERISRTTADSGVGRYDSNLEEATRDELRCDTQSAGILLRGAWWSLALLLTPLLLYYNTGWRQFGYRFSLDFWIVVMVLLAIAAGVRSRTGRDAGNPSMPLLMKAAILVGVVVNAWGVAMWFREP